MVGYEGLMIEMAKPAVTEQVCQSHLQNQLICDYLSF